MSVTRAMPGPSFARVTPQVPKGSSSPGTPLTRTTPKRSARVLAVSSTCRSAPVSRREEAVNAAKAEGLTVLAADGDGDLELDDANEILGRRTAWVFGNEAWGLPPEIAALADHRVRIPIYGRAESLNLSTAAALCLYASARAQRGKQTDK